MGNSQNFPVPSTSAARKTDRMILAGRHQIKDVIRSVVDVKKEVLGDGMSGEVRLASHRIGGPLVALKMFRVRSLPRKKLEQLANELDVHLALDSPHVARLLHVYETSNGDVHFILEYLQGGELFTRLSKRGKFEEREAASAMRQMLLAVAYLHAHQIVHRDIKLENFLYESEDGSHIKIIDFGLATRWGAQKRNLSHVCGSPDYIAPEVLSRSYTEKADIWPLGVIAYTLLCGVLPWDAISSTGKHGIRKGDPYFHPPLFDKLSEDARSFVRALLVARHRDRPSAASALQHPWLLRLARSGKHAASDHLLLDRTSLSKLRAFATEPPLKRLFMCFAAWSLPLRQQQPLRRQFSALCSEACGTIRRKDCLEALRSLNVSADEAEALFDALDVNNDGEISYSEFMSAMQAPAELDSDTVSLTFSRFDADGDGEVTVADLQAVLGSEGAFEGVSAEALVAAGGWSGAGVSLRRIEALLRERSPPCGVTYLARSHRHRQIPGPKSCWLLPPCFCFMWCWR